MVMEEMTPYHGQVYMPEADTLLLLESSCKEVRKGDRVLEVGTGSGLIARAVANITTTFTTDINPHSCRLARSQGLETIRTDLMDALTGPFDLIIFNPPYLPTRVDERIDDWLEYALDGGETGRAVIERFLADIPRILSRYGRVLLLVSSLTGLPEVQELCRRSGLISLIVAHRLVEDETLYVLRLSRDLCSMNGHTHRNMG
jgi:release factor glutamine methyltransferase